MRFSPRIKKAIDWAATLHHGQFKRDGVTPAVAHLVSVMLILRNSTEDEDVLIGGLLHDAVEDQCTTAEEIGNRFGSRVEDFVRNLTEPPKGPDAVLTWQMRKDEMLKNLQRVSEDVLLIAAADKLDILQNLIDIYKDMGDKTWDLFHAPKGKKLWYYGEVLHIIEERLHFPIVKEFRDKYNEALLLLRKE